MKTAKIVTMFTAGILLFSGCQATPDQSSVASKAEGLSEELMAEPLEPGELQEVDLPGNWSASEKKSNDRVTILADLEMGKLETGNLPVMEMKNHSMTQKELERFTAYFANGEELYVPQAIQRRCSRM